MLTWMKAAAMKKSTATLSGERCRVQPRNKQPTSEKIRNLTSKTYSKTRSLRREERKESKEEAIT